jgi:SAM-dependent methyltransferase
VTDSSTYAATDGEAYERFLGRFTRCLAPLFVGAMSLPGDGPLIDIGCGTGSCALALAAAFPDRPVVGIDIAEPYLAYARLRTGEARWPKFEIGDACAIRYPAGHFGGALSELVLNFVPDAERAAAEMRRITRRGGVAGACVWDFRGGLVYQRLFWDTAAGLDPDAGRRRDRLFSGALALPDGLAALWRRTGLVAVEELSLTMRMDYADFADYWDPLLGGQGPVGTYVAGLAPGTRERIEEAVRLAYLAGAPDGPRSMTATAWAVRGIVP